MALAPNTPPQFPDVPKAPGVPPVMRQAGAIENTVVAVASDAINVVKQFLGFGPTWGIFSPKTGQPVFASDSVVALDYRQEWRIADYPIERGGFVSYNKLKMPFDIRVSFSFAGNQGLLGSLIPGGALLSLIPGFSGADTRRTMLQMLDAAIARLDLVSVVTPEAQYPLVNIIHYDFRPRQPSRKAPTTRAPIRCRTPATHRRLAATVAARPLRPAAVMDSRRKLRPAPARPIRGRSKRSSRDRDRRSNRLDRRAPVMRRRTLEKDRTLAALRALRVRATTCR